MKKLLLIIISSFALSGCASTKSIDTKHCINVANRVESNDKQSGEQVYNQCLDKQYKKIETKKGFWEKTLENFFILFIDVATS